MTATTATTTNHAPAPAQPGAVPLKQDAAVIGLVGLAHATSHFSHLLLAPLFPVFMREFGLSYSDVGLLMSIFFVISGTGQALAGFVVDRVGARPVLFGAIGLFLLASLAAAHATGYPGLVLVAVLAGAGNAPFHPADFTILNQRVSAPRLGHAFSAHGLTGNLGWALAPVFLVGITSLSDWRSAYYAAAVLYAAVLLLLFAKRQLLKTEVVVRHVDAPQGADLAFMTLAVVQSFGPSILKAAHGASLEMATFTITAYMLCGAVGMVVGGFVATHTTRSDQVVAWAMAAGAVLLLVCATGWLGAAGTMVGLAATGFAVGVGGPSRDMMIKRATPKGATGRVYGLVYSGLDMGFAVSPVVFGGFMDKGWYGATLAGAALMLLLAVAAAVGVGRRTPSALDRG
jgi:MFS family permease